MDQPIHSATIACQCYRQHRRIRSCQWKTYRFPKRLRSHWRLPSMDSPTTTIPADFRSKTDSPVRARKCFTVGHVSAYYDTGRGNIASATAISTVAVAEGIAARRPRNVRYHAKTTASLPNACLSAHDADICTFSQSLAASIPTYCTTGATDSPQEMSTSCNPVRGSFQQSRAL